jgi:hypothetical protein
MAKGYIEYLEMIGDDVSKMKAAEHVDFSTEDAFGTVFLKEGVPLLAYVYTWAGPGPEKLLTDLGYKVIDVSHRGNGHWSVALSVSLSQ